MSELEREDVGFPVEHHGMTVISVLPRWDDAESPCSVVVSVWSDIVQLGAVWGEVLDGEEDGRYVDLDRAMIDKVIDALCEAQARLN